MPVRSTMSLSTGNQARPTIVAMPIENGDNTHVTYVFDSDDKQAPSESTLSEVTQWFCMSMVAFSFGIMLGWPSPNYPILLDPAYSTFPFYPTNFTSTPINSSLAEESFRITLVQSPLVAGLLMFGTILATPFSSNGYILYSIKHGILTSLLAMVLGWLIMWQSSNVYHLLISRFIIGLGYGYALGQIKTFTSGMIPWMSVQEQNRIKGLLLKMINVVMICGIICAFTMGTFLNFRSFAAGAALITIGIYLLVWLGMQANLPSEEQVYEEIGICTLLRTSALRKSTTLLTTLTFIQQFTGVPATIVYSQLIMLNLGLPTFIAPVCSIIYVLLYLLSYIIGTFYFSNFKYPKKRCLLLLSIFLTICSLALMIVILVMDLRQTCIYIPFAGMCLYVFVNGMGLGSIPNGFAEVLFPQKWRRCATDLQLMCFSTFAVIITKLFQVFFGEFPLEYIFVLFECVACVGIIFVAICFPSQNR